MASTVSEKKTNEGSSIEDTEENTNYQYIFKIILIGDSNTGKTSLLNRYIYNTFEKAYMCTIGVDFMMKKVTLDDSTNVKLQLWDTAGMEKFRQITSNYIRGAQGAIVVFDLTNRTSFEMVQRWVDFFCQVANPNYHQTILIVGNKCDLVQERVVSKEEIDQYLEINHFHYYETSAKSGVNVEGMFLDFTNQLVKQTRTTCLSFNPLGSEGSSININTKEKDTEKSKCCGSQL